MHTRARIAALAATTSLALTLAACGGDGTQTDAAGADPTAKPTLTLYNAQHEDLMLELTAGFTKATGIKVKMRNGDDFELANQLVQEGSASPADVFVTENSPAMTLVDSKGLFAKIDQATLGQVAGQFSPSDGEWTGFAARSTVLAYNTKNVPEAQLPASIMDLTQPRWKGKIGFSPSGADFQAIVSAVVDVEGEAAAKEWLAGLKANGKIYQGNTTVMKAVNSGEIDAGVIYHYYWYKDQAESGANSDSTRLHFFGNEDAGAFLSVSGAGVLKSSKNQAAAQEFVKYLNGEGGQKVLAASKALEYSINSAVPPNPALKPITELEPPQIELSSLNGPKVIELMQQAGLL
ncbi:MAG: iron(III) transport system substrate-binding protein [Actinomycetota bacterium]|nr:iron(III) transport system substrate-binding protein [Actinomycetota bacterium]